MATFFSSIPSREQQLYNLKSKSFDLIVIGGGATGAGIALDAVTRGLKVALLEKQDFSAGTSSRSTKLLHGGVRYLELAFKNLDWRQFAVLREALYEREIAVGMAPHLTRPLAISIPCYSWASVFYYGLGLKVYDFLSRKHGFGHSHFKSYKNTLKVVPCLSKKNLKGSIVYYDAQFNDARMNISLILTAAERGAVVSNYVSVIDLLKEKGKVVGVKIQDLNSLESWTIKSKMVVNATGAWIDDIRKLDEKETLSILRPSRGCHIVVDRKICPIESGILIPKTTDNRVIFILPWKDKILIGTTDVESEVNENPHPTEKELDYLLSHVNLYVQKPIGRLDIKAAWAGIRPLIAFSKLKDSAELARDHLIKVSSSGLITIAGGKWTTYRKMAQDTIDKAFEEAKWDFKPCQTMNIKIHGSEGNPSEIKSALKEQFHLDEGIANHLWNTYGSYALEVGQLCQKGYGQRLSNDYPFLEAEVIYAVCKEYACTVEDVLSRRLSLTFLDEEAAIKLYSRVQELMDLPSRKSKESQ